MKMKKVLILGFVLVFVFVLAACGNNVQIPQESENAPAESQGIEPVGTPDESGAKEAEEAAGVSWDVIEDAYMFTFPLVLLDATKIKTTNTVEATNKQAPENQLIHARKLADADSKDVVTPNVDTIYSQAFLNLEDTAMVYKTPPAEDRFCTTELLDAYTNCEAILYASGVKFLLTGPGFEGEVPEEMDEIPVSTNTVWLLTRTEVKDADDLENIYALQEQMELVPLDVYLSGEDYEPQEGSFDEENNFVPIEHVLGMGIKEYFDKANELLEKNPPAKEDADMMARIAGAGIGPGMQFDEGILPEGAQQKWQGMLDSFDENMLKKSAQFIKKMGAWTYTGEPIAEFGTEYAYRALIAKEGLGANPVYVAIYPKAATDDDGDALDGSDAYVIHFESDGFPPLLEDGFWSITAYGEDDFLIDNELNKYSISDRSDFTLNEDGSLDIFVQPDAPTDESMQKNWLPVKEGRFHVYLRIYMPDTQALAEGWTAPSILKG